MPRPVTVAAERRLAKAARNEHLGTSQILRRGEASGCARGTRRSLVESITTSSIHAQDARSLHALAEERLWQLLANSRLGVAFRRQVAIGEYIVDFAAVKERLVVEVDGGYHEGRARADARRDRALRRAGYRVLRLPAELVMADVVEAVARVAGWMHPQA